MRTIEPFASWYVESGTLFIDLHCDLRHLRTTCCVPIVKSHVLLFLTVGLTHLPNFGRIHAYFLAYTHVLMCSCHFSIVVLVLEMPIGFGQTFLHF